MEEEYREISWSVYLNDLIILNCYWYIMLLKHLDVLRDPITHEKLDIKVFEKEWEHIMSGELFSTKHHYPIVQGVPRLLVEELKTDLLQKKYDFFVSFKKELSHQLVAEWEKAVHGIKNLDRFLKHQKKTSESFAFEWNNIYKENDFEKHNFLHFLGGYIWEHDIKGKIILDVGCWSGRFVKMGAVMGAKISIGVDLSEAVDFAFGLTKHINNILIVQGDIYHLPFYHNIEIVQSIWVLHHLPDPQWGFTAIAQRVIEPKGKMIIWLYARKNNRRALYLYEPVRYITRHINKRVLLRLCHIPALIVHGINYLTRFIAWLGFKGVVKKMPFYYYINFPYNMKHNDAFDVLATPKSNYYYTEDIQKWFEYVGLKHIQGKYLHEAGLTFIWTYEA